MAQGKPRTVKTNGPRSFTPRRHVFARTTFFGKATSMTAGSISDLPAALQLADWRRRIASLYAAIRQAAVPQDAWDRWRGGRNALFREHPQSPLPEPERRQFRGLAFYPYDPGRRFVVDMLPLGREAGFTAELGSDGALHLVPAARTVGLSPIMGRELTLFSLSTFFST